MRKPDIQRKVENAIYCATNTDRLHGDHKAWSDGNLIDELNAYVFDSQLNSCLIEPELGENLPLKLPGPYETNYRSNDSTKQITREDKLELTHHRVGCLLTCACLHVRFSSSNPCVRAVKIHLRGAERAPHEPLTVQCPRSGHL
jgi:hypothetical protein